MSNNGKNLSNGKVDMLNGGMLRSVWQFALPLIGSGVLQQSFNTVDVAVVGRFTSPQALAAVGSTAVIIGLMLNLFVGISVGANVVIARYIGQKSADAVSRSIHTSMIVAVAGGLLLMLVGCVFADRILEIVGTPHDVVDDASTYLRIFFAGVPFIMVYNFGAAVLRSMGDTRRPFYALVFSGVVNVVLNLFLVIALDMGVSGVAVATVVANVINTLFVIYWLRREQRPYRLEWSKLRLSVDELKKILQIGVPAGLQSVVFSLSNVFILSAINRFGSDAVAGSSVTLNYEHYCYFVINAFAQATVAFVSQNYGAGRLDRCRKAVKVCLAMCVLSSGFLNILLAWQYELFAMPFTDSATVVGYAAVRFHIVLMFQFVASSYEITGAAMRGYGYSMTPAVLTIFGTCLLRLVWVWAVCVPGCSFATIFYIYPITWCITGVVVSVAYIFVSRKVNRQFYGGMQRAGAA